MRTRLILSLAVFVLMFADRGRAQSSQPVVVSGVITTVAGPALPATGTLATTQYIERPTGVAADGAGGFYVVSDTQNRVYRVAANGVLTVIAGDSTSGFSGDGGPAVSAQLASPKGVAVDSSGNVFIADAGNNRIRKVTPARVISTIAGDGPLGDGSPAVSASLNLPVGVAVDGSGNLFIAESNSGRIRTVNSAGIISTVAGGGFGGDGGPAVSAYLNPKGLALDRSGNIFIADGYSNSVRKVTASGIISTVAGNGTLGFSGDGGQAVAAQLYGPVGVAVDASGNIFIAEPSNYRVRRVTPAGVINTFAGGGQCANIPCGDGGPATSASLDAPFGVAIDDSGALLVAAQWENRVRKVATNGVITSVAGSSFGGDGGPATSALLKSGSGNGECRLAVDGSGNVFIADTDNHRIRRIDAVTGIITTVAGDGFRDSLGMGRFFGDGALATSASLNFPSGVAVDALGNIFVADRYNFRVRKVDTSGRITTVAGNGTSVSQNGTGDGGPATLTSIAPNDVALDVAGNLFISDFARIRRVDAATGIVTTVAGNGVFGFSGDGGPATAASVGGGDGLTVDAAGNIFLAAFTYNRIRKVDAATGIISTIAGNGLSGPSLGDGGPATAATMQNPVDVSVDRVGNVYFSDANNNRIRKIDAGALTVRTIAGGVFGLSGDGGPAIGAGMSLPAGIALDVAGNLYTAESGSRRIRKVTFNERAGFSIGDLSGISLVSSGTSASLTTGFASVQMNGGSLAPAGLAIFGFRQNGILVTEAGVPASPLIQSGRVYAEINSSVNTGLAITNPSSQTATIPFYFTDSAGNNFGGGLASIPPNGQVVKFLDQSPFNSGTLAGGTFTFASSVPVAAIALRGLTNERSEFLITTLPVTDLDAPAPTGTIIFPDFADGGGWSSQLILVNPRDTAITGAIEFLSQSGAVSAMTLNGQQNTSFTYSIPARSSRKFQSSGAATSAVSGSVRVVPAGTSAAPTGLEVFSYRTDKGTVTEAGVPSQPAGGAFRVYVEATGALGAIGSVQTGLAIANTSGNIADVRLELTTLEGLPTGLTGTFSIEPHGQRVGFLNQIPGLASLQSPFHGILRVSSQSSISVLGLRGRYNERSDFLITTTPPSNEAASAQSALYFPHIVDGQGYTTQFILFSSQPGPSPNGTLSFFNPSGGAWNAPVH